MICESSCCSRRKERSLPEDEDHDNFEDQCDVSKQSDKSAELVLIATILFIFFRRAAVNNEELEEVVNPGDSDQEDKATEGLSGD